jgi:hypothetical protein
VLLTGTLSANGGAGGPFADFFAGVASEIANGGGRVDILTLPDVFSSTGSINVNGGLPGASVPVFPPATGGDPGQITISVESAGEPHPDRY